MLPSFNPFFIRSVVPTASSRMRPRTCRSVSIPSSSGQWCQRQTGRDQAQGRDQVSIPSSSGQWCQQIDSQCCIHIEAWFQSLLHQVSGANLSQAERIIQTAHVSIPSSSGQWCQRTRATRLIRSWHSFNPFFIRSVVPTKRPRRTKAGARTFQSLLHQVSGANFLGRENGQKAIYDVSIPSSSGQWCQLIVKGAAPWEERRFQSLLHQVSGANSTAIADPNQIQYVSIPSSSGQWCQRLARPHASVVLVRRFNPFFIRSVVPTPRSTPRICRSRPTFQSLLHQVSGANKE